jgi:hypothetical protein
MASFTQITKRKRARRHRNMGHDRKVAQAKRSTVSYTELFAACGEPGEPAPQVGSQTVKQASAKR